MYQGDQYYIPFTITMSGSAIDDDYEDLVGVKVSINDEIERTWNKEDDEHKEVFYNTDVDKWMFLIYEDDTLSLQGKFKIQIRLKLEGPNDTYVIKASKPVETSINRSVFTEVWDA